ncbi:hypothetical protein TcasGA2_TC032619 [Tribolium castaneum]|uniref:SIAH-type domain-containing protein n=1 Tax=Tribolium castaneum TaxID=7070 RepID=A0A139WKH5_TRICA|nr:hypothetical protein TcasGA2_TC032619 [Tribolium castaneum]
MSELPIIPDQVLEAYTCRLCDKYLTVIPISIHPEGGNICGRCQSKVTKQSHCLFECDSDLLEQINLPYAIFGYVNHLFPCVNRYEGCDRLLTFDEISNHETTCPSRKIICKYCNYEGTGCQQLNHFKTKHPLNFFDRIYFRFPLDHHSHSMNLIKRGHELFFLYFEIDDEKQKVTFLVEPTRKSLGEDIDFFCLLKDAEHEDVFNQTTISRRKTDGICHTIYFKEEQFLKEFDIFCECLLKKVSSCYKSNQFCKF